MKAGTLIWNSLFSNPQNYRSYKTISVQRQPHYILVYFLLNHFRTDKYLTIIIHYSANIKGIEQSRNDQNVIKKRRKSAVMSFLGGGIFRRRQIDFIVIHSPLSNYRQSRPRGQREKTRKKISAWGNLEVAEAKGFLASLFTHHILVMKLPAEETVNALRVMNIWFPWAG